jgi:hypothetical protein
MSIVGPRSGENKAFTRDEKSAATQLVKDRPVPLPEPQTLSSKLRGLAELQSGNCNEIGESQGVCAD